MLDLLVVNREEPVSQFRNLGRIAEDVYLPSGNNLTVQLDNGPINPHAIGAVVELSPGTMTQSPTVHIGGGHASGQMGMVHFGLAGSETTKIRVK